MKNIHVIKWIDSYGVSSSWEDITDVEMWPVVCTSVGVLVKETKDYVVLCPHCIPSNETVKEQKCDKMVIPKVAIQTHNKLWNVKKDKEVT